MACRLSYKYQEGECLRYEQVLTTLVRDAAGEQTAGTMTTELTVQVLETLQDGSWNLELTTRALAAEGFYTESLNELGNLPAVTLRMTPSGVVRLADDSNGLFVAPSLPEQDLEVGDAWTWEAPGGGDPTTYILQSVDEQDGGLIARYVSTTQTQAVDEESGVSVPSLVESVSTFSLDGGCLLESTTVMESTDAEGTQVSVVVEVRLLERSSMRVQLGTY